MSVIELQEEGVRASQPRPRLAEFLKRDTSLAKDASDNAQLLPNVEILGILYCKGMLHIEHSIFEDLLDLPSLRHIVYHHEQDFDVKYTGWITLYNSAFGKPAQAQVFSHTIHVCQFLSPRTPVATTPPPNDPCMIGLSAIDFRTTESPATHDNHEP